MVQFRAGSALLALRGRESALGQFRNESGGHRFQRIPPTEHRGRVHTSTITVAVIEPPETTGYKLDLSQVEITTSHGDGPGGQHMQKTESVVIVTYKPTGERVKIGTTRSQLENKELALSVLAGKLAQKEQERLQGNINTNRREQIGSGQRGDKVRTIRVRDDLVTDHRTGQTWSWSKWKRGIW